MEQSGATTVASGAALSISGGLTVAEPITISGTGISSGGAIVFTGGNNTYSGAITLGATSTIVSLVEHKQFQEQLMVVMV